MIFMDSPQDDEFKRKYKHDIEAEQAREQEMEHLLYESHKCEECEELVADICLLHPVDVDGYTVLLCEKCI
jgi:hypothetical protein